MGNRLGGAVRSGDYKLIRSHDDQSLELYNLKSDLGESKNLAKAAAALAKRLDQKLSAWLKETVAKMPKPPKQARVNFFSLLSIGNR